MQLALFILICDGIAMIVTQSSLFERLRYAIRDRSEFFGQLIRCPMCFGFWTGIFVHLFVVRFPLEPLVWSPAVHMFAHPFFAGALSSATCYTLHLLRGKLSSVI